MDATLPHFGSTHTGGDFNAAARLMIAPTGWMAEERKNMAVFPFCSLSHMAAQLANLLLKYRLVGNFSQPVSYSQSGNLLVAMSFSFFLGQQCATLRYILSLSHTHTLPIALG